MKTKTILVPVDLSDHSKNLINYATELAIRFNSRLIILHTHPLTNIPQTTAGYMGTVEPIYPTFADVEDYAAIKEDKLKVLDSFISEVPIIRSVPYEKRIAIGQPSDLICEEARNNLVDLIVMGTSGASGLEEILVGTRGESVTRNAPCPVLVLPEKCQYKPIRSIYLAVDEDSLEHNAQLELLVKIARYFHSEVHMIYVTDKISREKGQLIMDKLNHAVNDLKYSFHIITHDDPEKGLNSIIEENEVSLVALIYREHNFLERIFSPGLRKKMVFHTEKPLLILK